MKRVRMRKNLLSRLVLSLVEQNEGIDAEEIAETLGISSVLASDVVESLLRSGELDFVEGA